MSTSPQHSTSHQLDIESGLGWVLTLKAGVPHNKEKCPQVGQSFRSTDRKREVSTIIGPVPFHGKLHPINTKMDIGQ